MQSEGSENSVGAGNGDDTLCLNLVGRQTSRVSFETLHGWMKTYPDVGNLEVVDDERVALGAGTEVNRGQVLGQAELRRPLRVGVRKRENLSNQKNQ